MTSQQLPAHASVVVIGGGVMGCSTLYHLTKSGVGDAILIERNKLTSGTTWHSAAQVRALRSTRNLTEMVRYSISLYSQLEEETGLRDVALRQIGAFGKAKRDPREHVVSIAYLGIVNRDEHDPVAADDASEVRWFPLDDLPPLAFDHAEIIAKGRELQTRNQ